MRESILGLLLYWFQAYGNRSHAIAFRSHAIGFRNNAVASGEKRTLERESAGRQIKGRSAVVS
jgi:hypothetical protein